MHPDWKNFLETLSSQVKDNYLASIGDARDEARATLQENIIADCSDMGVLHFSGEDARDFLHNQLSNDVNALTENESRLAAYCNPKGRALAVVRVYGQGDDVFMLLPRDVLPAVAKRLQMFVLMSKVTITDISEELVIAGIAGEAVSQQLALQVGELPSQDNGVTHHDSLTIIRLPFHASRYLIIGQAATIITSWKQLSEHAVPVGQQAWQLLNIYTGQPEVHTSTVEAFVPQMLNMHAIEGISFKKGCYPGQEIVARMYYLGKLKRRMYRAHAAVDDCPQPGDALFAAHSSSGQGAGQVVLASPSAEGGYDLLMVCPVNIVDAGPVLLGSESGPELEIKTLPYDVPLERESS